jgi:hypothetical protein
LKPFGPMPGPWACPGRGVARRASP